MTNLTDAELSKIERWLDKARPTPAGTYTGMVLDSVPELLRGYRAYLAVMRADEAVVERVARAIMLDDLCGLTIMGERVFCDDTRGGEPRTNCLCKSVARAALAAMRGQ